MPPDKSSLARCRQLLVDWPPLVKVHTDRIHPFITITPNQEQYLHRCLHRITFHNISSSILHFSFTSYFVGYCPTPYCKSHSFATVLCARYKDVPGFAGGCKHPGWDPCCSVWWPRKCGALHRGNFQRRKLPDVRSILLAKDYIQ